MFDMFKQMFSDGDDYFGRRLEVPELPPLADVLGGGVSANRQALPGIQELGRGVNAFNQEETLKLLERMTPGFTEGLKGSSANAYALIRGEVPGDVSDAIMRSGAARALGGGYAGTPFARNATLRDLGLTSLEGQARGAAELRSTAGLVSGLFPQFDVTGQLATPAMALDYTYSKFQRDLLAAKAAAGPDPAARGRADQEMALMGMILSAYSGGSGYNAPASTNPYGGGYDAPIGGGQYSRAYTPQGGGGGYNWGGGGSGMMSSGGGGASNMSSALGIAFCWVARAVYGDENPKWLEFREFMLNKAPAWLFNLYSEAGPSFAEWLNKNPIAKDDIRPVMDAILEKHGTA